MKIIKKIATVLGSALLIGATAGMAAAASFPAPFVQGGVADVAVVVGSNAALSDGLAATNIGNDLASALAAQTVDGNPGSVVSGTAWQVQTSSDELEIGEPINDVENYITDTELAILADGEIDNEKGTASYEQFLYFEDTATGGVNYTENDDDEIGLFYYIKSGNQIARYVMDFTTNLKSDAIAGDSAEDIEDEEINFLGKTYTIITAKNQTNTATDCDMHMTLMSGAAKGTVGNDEEIVVGGKTVSAVVSSATEARLTVDGEETNKLSAGDTYKLADDTYLGITDITYQDYAGGIQKATFYVGADKIELNNGSSMVVNADTISEAAVEIECTTSNGDVEISEISVNMSAGDDFFVPVDGKLSEAIAAVGEDEKVLITENWDIEFKGLEAHNSEDILLRTVSSDKRLEITFDNYDGDTITLPVFFVNETAAGSKIEAIYSGEKTDRRLMLGFNSSSYNSTLHAKMTKGDLFVLNTADPRSSGNNARTYVAEYKGHDRYTNANPKVNLRILGESEDRSITLGSAVGANWSIRLGGTTFNFYGVTSLATKDQPFILAGKDWVTTNAVGENSSRDIYLRTKYNALINITDEVCGNNTFTDGAAAGSSQGPYSAWTINISVDDANRDGDHFNIGDDGNQQIVWTNWTNSTTASTIEVDSRTTKTTTNWKTDPSDSDVEWFRTTYGALIKKDDSSSSPAQFDITIPESITEPLVYVSSGEISVTTSASGASELGQVTVLDTEASAMSGKNLIVIGGSCINSVAADLLGSAACEADFTALTTIGAGEALIKSFDKDGKVALLVAGYNAADTTKAATYLANNAVDTAVGSALKVTSATQATTITSSA